jgi:3-hydroxyacyl-CoA dehydrogenase/enoyl-CoA hydratase/3-hydroxybutyryl-CoA epimerase
VVFISGKKDNVVAGAKIGLPADHPDGRRGDGHLAAGAGGVSTGWRPLASRWWRAIHGSCLGGGLEWALACGYRIATDSPKTSLGLPEVQLGLLPGAGGTQRLPALIGAPAAMDLILAAKTVKPAKAKKLGIVDEVVPVPVLRQVALQRARELAAGTLQVERVRGQDLKAVVTKPKGGLKGLFQSLAKKELWTEVALEDNPLGRKVMFDQARKALLKKTRGKYPAPEKALQAIRVGLESGRKAGLEAEARLFGELVVSTSPGGWWRCSSPPRR